LRKIHTPSIAHRLGLSTRDESTLFIHSLQRFANSERKEYEEKLLQLINKYSIRGEGEVCTGCIRKYHKLYKKRQNEFSQDIKRQYRELRKQFRSTFFRKVKSLVEKELLRESNDATDPVDTLAGEVGGMSMDNDKKPAAKKASTKAALWTKSRTKKRTVTTTMMMMTMKKQFGRSRKL
jgi:hypothetical protein